MPIRMKCENAECLKAFLARDESAGKRVKCPGCGQIVRVPGGDAEPEPDNAPPENVPGVRETPGPGRFVAGFFWLLFSAATLASLGYLAFLMYHEAETDKQVAASPAVKKARADWMIDRKDDSYQRLQNARDQARPDSALDGVTLRLYLVYGLSAAGTSAQLALVAFIVFLAKSRVHFVYDCVVWCFLVAPILALVGAGAGAALSFYTQHKIQTHPDLRILSDQVTEARLKGNHAEVVRLQDLLNERTNVFNSTQWLVGAAAVVLSGLIAAIAVLCGPFCFAIMLYKLWVQVQDDQARTSPGFALFGLLIPLFNFYWYFVVFVGLAKELNRCAAKRSLKVERVSVGLMITHCILGLLTAVPFINVLIFLVNLFIGLSVFGACSRVATALANAAPSTNVRARRGGCLWLTAAASVVLAAAGGVTYYFVAPEPIGNTARRAEQVASWTATNSARDVVCLIKLNGTIPLDEFNAIPKERRFIMAQGRRCEFLQTQTTTYHGYFDVSEYVILICIVPRSATTATLHLGDRPPIELNLGSSIARKIEISRR